MVTKLYCTDQDILCSFRRHPDGNESRKELTVKEKCTKRLESTGTTVFMTVVTIYSLFSYDVQLLALDKSADLGFVVCSLSAFFFFSIEIILQCWCKEFYIHLPDTKGMCCIKSNEITHVERSKNVFSAIRIGSFYFWIDTTATLSILLELLWVCSSRLGGEWYFKSLGYARAGRASMAGARATKIVKAVRMVRLVRLMKLYKYFSTRKHTSEATGFEEIDIDERPKETKIGAEMSDRTTKRVIVGILMMLVVIPLIQVENFEYANEFGMKMVFEKRRAISYLSPESMKQDKEGVTNASLRNWQFEEEYFIKTSKCIMLSYEGFTDEEHTVANIPQDRATPESLRSIEKSYLQITDSGGQIYMSAYFNISSKVQEVALAEILLTCFVIVLLAAGTITFSRDVNNLVIIPIEKMLQLVREIIANPLCNNFSLKPEEIDDMDDGMETTLLLGTLSKIAGLMKVGFGEAGAEIIGKHLNMGYNGDGASCINLLGNGSRIQAIFAFCDVRNFTDTTECLQEEVMLFVNRIAHILHSIAAQCGGAANKNIGDAFLLTWKVDTENVTSCADHNYSGDKALYSLLKTMVELSRHNDFVSHFSPSAMTALYERMPGYKCRIGCGLHFGWGIEGAIGSNQKIDASYVSPHVNWAEHLESSTKKYDVPLLMSEPFFRLLSPEVTKYCRQVDIIKNGPDEDLSKVFTYDTDLNIEFDKPETHIPFMFESKRKSDGSLSTTTTLGPRDSLLSSSSSRPAYKHMPLLKSQTMHLDVIGDVPHFYLPTFTVQIWESDEDMVRLRQHFTEKCRAKWLTGIEAYSNRDWKAAAEHFKYVLRMSKNTDGPSRYLLKQIEAHLIEI